MTSTAATAAPRRAGYTAVAWGALFVVVHAYWAAGGAVGMNGQPADTPGAQLYIGFITLLGIAGTAVGLRLARGHRDRATLVLARVGGGVLLIGVALGTGRWLAEGGADVAGVVITTYFLAGGVIFSVLARRAGSAAPSRAAQGRPLTVHSLPNRRVPPST